LEEERKTKKGRKIKEDRMSDNEKKKRRKQRKIQLAK
jgi:hypothetical protein